MMMKWFCEVVKHGGMNEIYNYATQQNKQVAFLDVAVVGAIRESCFGFLESDIHVGIDV